MAIVCPFPGTETTAQAQAAKARAIDIPPLPLDQALESLARQAGISMAIDGDLPRVRAPAVHGARDARAAFDRLLAGMGFVAIRISPTAWRIQAAPRRPAPPVVHAPPAIGPPPAEDITVMATKQDMPWMRIPQSVSVLTLASGDRHDPARDTAYVASEVDGLNLTALGPGRNRLFLRGVADSPFNDANQSPVAIVLDGTRLTYSAPDPDLRLVDVERVELLKGPQGALYGLGTLGGVYHVVSAPANVDRVAGNVSAGIDDVMHGQLGASGSVMANVPLLPGRVALRVVAYDSHEPGWIDTGSRRNANVTEVGGARASLGMEVGGGWRVDLGAMTQHITTGDSQYTYAVGSFWRPQQLPERHHNDLDHVSARARGHIGAVKAEMIGSLTSHEVSDTFDATIGASGFGLASPSLFSDARDYHLGEGELRLSGNLDHGAWLLGFSYTEARENDVRSLSSSTPVPDLIIDRASRLTRDAGVFGKLDVPLARRLGLELGGRAYHSAQRGDFVGGNQELAQATSRWDLTPSAALSWQARASRLFYLHYGTAYRPGVLDFSWRGKVRALAGDSLRTLEGGWRERLPGGGEFDANGSVIWWRNIQSDHLLPNGLIAAHNAGNARILGMEATLDLPLRQHWHISAGASVQEARVVRTNPAIPAQHRNLPVIPTLTLRSSLTRDFRLGSAAARVKASLRYLGPARLSFDPMLDRSMGHVLESTLEAGIDWGRTRLDIKITNPLQRLDNRFAYGNPFRVDTPQYTPQRPFGVSLAITRAF